MIMLKLYLVIQVFEEGSTFCGTLKAKAREVTKNKYDLWPPSDHTKIATATVRAASNIFPSIFATDGYGDGTFGIISSFVRANARGNLEIMGLAVVPKLGWGKTAASCAGKRPSGGKQTGELNSGIYRTKTIS